MTVQGAALDVGTFNKRTILTGAGWSRQTRQGGLGSAMHHLVIKISFRP